MSEDWEKEPWAREMRIRERLTDEVSQARDMKMFIKAEESIIKKSKNKIKLKDESDLIRGRIVYLRSPANGEMIAYYPVEEIIDLAIKPEFKDVGLNDFEATYWVDIQKEGDRAGQNFKYSQVETEVYCVFEED